MPSQPNEQTLEQKIQQLETKLAKLTQEKEAIEKQALIYKTLFMHAPFEIHVWQVIRDDNDKIQNWKLVDANPKALRLWGKTLDNVAGKTTDAIFPGANPIDAFMPTVERIFESRSPFAWEQYFSGTDQTLRMVSIPFANYFISTGIDVSDLKRAENDLRIKTQAAESANTAKSQFLANMSHEMRTPLNAIIGFSQLLLMKSNKIDPSLVKNISNIKKSGDVLLGLIDNVLDFSKIESGNIEISNEEISIADYIQRIMMVTKVSRDEKSITLEALVDPTLPSTIRSDISMLDRISINLISNAVKFSPAESRIQLALKHKNHQYMQLEIRDEGIGIDKENFEKIFNNFEQADNSLTRVYGGTGLGLAIVRRMVDILGGSITVESAPGAGSTFRVLLPLHQTAETANPEVTNPQPTPSIPQNKAILVAEDDDMNRQMIGSLLESLGAKITFAHNGQEAIEKARTMLEAGNLDIMLLDLHMPIMDGFTAAKHLKQDPALRKIPLIAVSADVLEKQKKRAFDAGFDDYVTKPIELDQLVHVIRQFSAA